MSITGTSTTALAEWEYIPPPAQGMHNGEFLTRGDVETRPNSDSEGDIGIGHSAEDEGLIGMEVYMSSKGHRESGLAIANLLNIGVTMKDSVGRPRSHVVAPSLGGLTMLLELNVASLSLVLPVGGVV